MTHDFDPALGRAEHDDRRPRRSGAMLLACLLALTSTSALAQALPPVEARSAEALTQPDADNGDKLDVLDALEQMSLLDPAISPEQVTELLEGLWPEDDALAKGGPTATGYELHRKWGVNGVRDDLFAGSNSGNYQASAAARLANGHVVVVGTVNYGSTAELGLVKYNSRGQRVTWTAASAPYGQFGNGYLVFPRSDPWGGSRISGVADVKVRNNVIYVLVTKRKPDGRDIPGIIRFRDDGLLLNSSAESAPDGGAQRSAVAMDILGDKMIVLGRRSIFTSQQDGGFWTTRWTINSDGSLAIGATTTFNAGIRIVPADVTFLRNNNFILPASPTYWVAYTLESGSSGRTDPCLARINANNQFDTGFNGNGSRCLIFNNNDRQDFAVALHNRGFSIVGGSSFNEALYLVANVERGITHGTGIVNLTNGVTDTNFGTGGRRLYGGCESNSATSTVGEGCGRLYIDGVSRTHTPSAVYSSASPNGVFIVGAAQSGSILNNQPMIMDINASNGALRSLQGLTGPTNSSYADLVPRGNTGELTVVGTANGALQGYFISSHLVKRNDLIFYDGLQTP